MINEFFFLYLPSESFQARKGQFEVPRFWQSQKVLLYDAKRILL